MQHRKTDRQTDRQADRQKDRQTDRQTDRQMDRQTGLILKKHFPKDGASIMFFRKFENKIF